MAAKKADRVQAPRGGTPPAWGKRFEKHRREAAPPASLGLVHRVYADAIECARPNPGRGIEALWGVMAGAACSGAGWGLSVLFDGAAAPLAVGVVLGVYVGLWLLHGDLFAPEDFGAVVFDRRRRKLLRLDVQAELRFSRPFRGRRWQLIEHDWDRLAVQHERQAGPDGLWRHHLVFMQHVGKGLPGPTAQFRLSMDPVIGPAHDTRVESLWEHLRRYMEEEGPPRPFGEAEPVPPPRPGWWQCLFDLPLLGPRYRPAWRRAPLRMACLHAAAPLALPFFLLWASLRWLSHLSAEQVPWPLQERAPVRRPQRGRLESPPPPVPFAPVELRDIDFGAWRLQLLHAGCLLIDLAAPRQLSLPAYERYGRWLRRSGMALAVAALALPLFGAGQGASALLWLGGVPVWLLAWAARPVDPGFQPQRLELDSGRRQLRIEGWRHAEAEVRTIPFKDLARVYVRLVRPAGHSTGSGSSLVLVAGRDPEPVVSANLRFDSELLLAWIVPLLPRHVLLHDEGSD